MSQSNAKVFSIDQLQIILHDLTIIVSSMRNKEEDSVHGGIGYWIGSLASAFRKGLGQELAPFNVTPVQWAILELYYRGEANTVSSPAPAIWPATHPATLRPLGHQPVLSLSQRVWRRMGFSLRLLVAQTSVTSLTLSNLEGVKAACIEGSEL